MNELIDLTVTATDADGDGLSYQWADDCHGNFGSPTASKTTWWNGSAQSCAISVTVTSKTNYDVGRINLVVSTVSASLAITAEFIPVPYVNQFALTGGGMACTISRDAPDASCRPAILANTVLTATVTFDPMPADSGGNLVLTDSCGGSETRTALDLPNGKATFSWTAPAVSGSCLLTATATRETLSDAQRVAVAIQ